MTRDDPNSKMTAAGLDGYWRIEVVPPPVRLARTGKRSDDMPAFLASFEAIYAWLGGRLPSTLVLQCDLRTSVGRNDPEFEAGLEERRRGLLDSFRRTALVVQSAVGQLQVQRHIQSDGLAHKAHVFTDPDTARDWLLSP